MSKKSLLPVAAAALLIGAEPAGAALFKPDTATASSEFSSGYVAENTINGSGLPSLLDINAPHETYVFGNHWTTSGDSPTDQHIVWGFGAGRDVGGLYIWNHLSNNIAANSGYEPVLFDLTLFDAGNNILELFDDLDLQPNTNVAQLVDLGAVYSNVASVRFDVEATESSGSYTGLAEVVFTSESSSIPEPASLAVIGAGLLGWAFARRSRKG